MNYEEALREADKYFSGAIVMTGGYDDDMTDHLAEQLGQTDWNPEVAVEWGNAHYYDVTVPAMVLRKVDEQGYIDNGEALARIVSYEDYDKLERE